MKSPAHILFRAFSASDVIGTRDLAQKLQCSYTVNMSLLRFEWDPKKAVSNQRKHGVSFDEAETAFLDDEAVLIPDAEHSSDEDRFLILGFSYQLRILIVCHC